MHTVPYRSQTLKSTMTDCQGHRECMTGGIDAGYAPGVYESARRNVILHELSLSVRIMSETKIAHF